MSVILRTMVLALLATGMMVVQRAGDGSPEGTAAAAALTATAAARSGSASGNCAGSRRDPGGPDPWGGCWPGPHNTGVPAGTSLTSYSGDRTISRRGAVVSGWDVDGCIIVTAVGVTIENSRAGCVKVEAKARYCRAGETAAEKALTGCTVVPGVSSARRSPPRLVVRDSEIRCPDGLGESGLGDRNMLVLRVDISHCENGLSVDSYVKVKDSYVHDLYNAVEGDPHTDGLQGLVGRRLILEHNVFFAFTPGCSYPSVDARCNGNAAITIGGQRDFPSVRHTAIRRNLLAGGSYTLYCPFVVPKGFAVIDNRFSEVYSPKVGEYGTMSQCGGRGVTKRGNKRINY